MKKPTCPECSSTVAYNTGYAKEGSQKNTSAHYKCGGCGAFYFHPPKK